MMYSTQIKPISYLKSHTAEIVKNLGETRKPLLITQNGEAKLAVIDIKSFEEREETLSLLKILALGNSEIEQQKYQEVENLFSDLDNSN